MVQILPSNTFTTAKWIVSASASDGTHTTIATALTSASSGDTIFIRTGTYTENITLKAGVNLTAFGSDGITSFDSAFSTPNVIILGTVTASYNGSCCISGIQLQTNSAAALATSGSNTSNLILNNCSVYANNATGMTFNSANFNVEFYSCTFYSTSTNLLFAVTTGPLNFQSCIFELSATASASTIAVTTAQFNACDMSGLDITTSSTGSVVVTNCAWVYAGNTLLTTVGTGSSSINNSSLQSTSASTISIGTGSNVTITNSSINSSNTNAITGAGTILYGEIVFTGTSSTINTTTQTILIASSFQKTVVQVFTSTGTYTPTPGMKYCTVEIVGGGAGGGGAAASSAVQSAAGGGGGAGAYVRQTFSASTIGANQSVAIGAAGLAGANTPGTGGAGGNTVFGAIIQANGGLGGALCNAGILGSVSGGLGGIGVASGDFGITGMAGGAGLSIFSSTGLVISGAGGSSYFGGGARSVPFSSVGVNGTSYGGGGSGGASTTGTAAVAGGAGFKGICVITEYV